MKKIVVTGPECTGKSSLTKALAHHFDCPYREEYARDYITQLSAPYSQRDILEIAKRQLEIEKTIPKNSSYLFLDTDLIVCKVWSEFKYNYCDPWILEKIKDIHYDFYLLCDIDLTWQNDGMREHPNDREKLLDIYEKELKFLKKPYALISGKNRTQMAIDIVKRYA